MNAKRVIWLTSLAATAVTVSACAAPASRYRTDAITFIDSDTMFDAYGADFENVDCSEPASTDDGETVTCRADDTNRQSYVMTFTIIGKNELELTDIALLESPPSSDVAESSLPESSLPQSSAPAGSAAEPASAPPTSATGSSPAPAPTTAGGAPTVTAPAPGPAPTPATSSTTTTAPG